MSNDSLLSCHERTGACKTWRGVSKICHESFDWAQDRFDQLTRSFIRHLKVLVLRVTDCHGAVGVGDGGMGAWRQGDRGMGREGEGETGAQRDLKVSSPLLRKPCPEHSRRVRSEKLCVQIRNDSNCSLLIRCVSNSLVRSAGNITVIVLSIGSSPASGTHFSTFIALSSARTAAITSAISGSSSSGVTSSKCAAKRSIASKCACHSSADILRRGSRSSTHALLAVRSSRQAEKRRYSSKDTTAAMGLPRRSMMSGCLASWNSSITSRRRQVPSSDIGAGQMGLRAPCALPETWMP